MIDDIQHDGPSGHDEIKQYDIKSAYPQSVMRVVTNSLYGKRVRSQGVSEMTVMEFLAKFADRARTLAGRDLEDPGRAEVRVILPDGSEMRVREIQPGATSINIYVEPTL